MSHSKSTHRLAEEINERIKRLHSELAVLRHTQNQNFSPVHRLPDELLSIVFTHTVVVNRFSPVNTTLQSCALQRPRSEASLIGMICRQWRRVSLSTPHIWGRISFAIHRDAQSGCYDSCAREEVLAALRTHLARSGDVPLEVDVCLEPEKGHWKSVAYSKMSRDSLWEVVLGQSGVFRRLGCLVVQMHSDWMCGLDMVKNVLTRECLDGVRSAPRLNAIQLEFGTYMTNFAHSSDEALRDGLCTIVSNTSITDISLRFKDGTYRIAISGFDVSPHGLNSGVDAATHSCVPYSAITEAALSNPTLNNATTLIALSPSLVTLNLDMRDSVCLGAPFPACAPIHLANLEELAIILPRYRRGRQDCHITLKRILRGIASCSSLSSLSIASSDPSSSDEELHEDEIHDVILEFLVRSRAKDTSKTLIFQRMPLTSSHILSILRITPYLTDLELVETARIYTTHIGNDVPGLFVAKGLAGIAAEMNLLPKLRRIRLDIWNDWHDVIRLFADMVEIRTHGLESAVLEVRPPTCRHEGCPQLDRLWTLQREAVVAVRVLFGDQVVVGYGDGELSLDADHR
ncbi:hypothetical protein V5O48_007229 [Marasmius crinis-equi]|uniref:F-box domain-containing protein n=1 Tax=Marasmius crinis-equi TaxID=585013 RepID=A0ABR3FHI5_9AGAR